MGTLSGKVNIVLRNRRRCDIAGDVRDGINYRKLNESTIKDVCSLPHIDMCQDCLQQNYFNPSFTKFLHAERGKGSYKTRFSSKYG